MMWIKAGWVGALFIFFLLFSAWYGGNGKPLSLEEGRGMLNHLRAVHGADPNEVGGLLRNLEEMLPNDDGKEFYAVNLETLKEGEAAQQADRAYAGIVMPLLFKRASHPVFVSNRAGLMLGEYGNEIDRVAVVRYRSLRDLISMASEPAMVEGSPYKFAALDHTEVFITRPSITFMHVRFVLALILLIIGALGWIAIHRFARGKPA